MAGGVADEVAGACGWCMCGGVDGACGGVTHKLLSKLYCKVASPAMNK